MSFLHSEVFDEISRGIEQLDLFDNLISDREWFWNATAQELLAYSDHPNHCDEYEDADDCTDWVKNTCFGCKYLDKCREEFKK